jgi:hypothetical protein
MARFKIYYGRYGRKSKIVKARNFAEVHKKYSRLNLDQIEKLTKNS